MKPHTFSAKTLIKSAEVNRNFDILYSPPEGYLMNGVITPSVASDDLTVAIKGLDGNDPSATNPVYVRIGDTVRSITSALSVTKDAGTNWCNAGSSELATEEIDYFVYLGYNATDGVVIGFSRIPYANQYNNFSTTTTDEDYCAISTITNAAAGDDYEVIGRFAATLSAGAGYTWSVPTFTTVNLVQRPIYKTRELIFNTTIVGFSGTPSQVMRYRIIDRIFYLQIYISGTSNDTTFTFTYPFISNRGCYVPIPRLDSGTAAIGIAIFTTANNIANLYSNGALAGWTNSGTKEVRSQNFNLSIA